MILLDCLQRVYVFPYFLKIDLNVIICRRSQISQETLFKQIPNQEEQELAHDFFMKTVDHKQMSFKARYIRMIVNMSMRVFFI